MIQARTWSLRKSFRRSENPTHAAQGLICCTYFGSRQRLNGVCVTSSETRHKLDANEENIWPTPLLVSPSLFPLLRVSPLFISPDLLVSLHWSRFPDPITGPTSLVFPLLIPLYCFPSLVNPYPSNTSAQRIVSIHTLTVAHSTIVNLSDLSPRIASSLAISHG